VDNEPRALIAALRHSHERLASLVGAMTGDQLTSQSYCDDWSVAQVLSHLGSGAEIAMLGLTAGLDGTPPDRDAIEPIWAAWNAKTPQQQAADCLVVDDTHITRLEGLTDAELAGISVNLFGMDLDAAALIRMRLSEHALHTWDVAVTLDPAAEVAPDAVELVLVNLPMAAAWTGRPDGKPFRVRVRCTAPAGDYVLDVGEKVALSPWPAGGPAAAAAESQIQLPAEALLRLVAGRLDPTHTPAVEVVGDDPGILDRVRAVFPGM